jgi:glutathione S-transferase
MRGAVFHDGFVRRDPACRSRALDDVRRATLRAGIDSNAGTILMADYDLFYWPVPFRGQFVRALLAYAGKSWTEADPAAIPALMEGPIDAMPVPFMGPPVLFDTRAHVAIAQMPAIVLYLGETLELMPASPVLRAMTFKTVNDANDVIDEITLDGGRAMWTNKGWQAFVPRLQKWMALWEETGRRHGLTAERGFLLGGDAPGVADVVTATLWSTMTDRYPAIATMLEAAAPMTAALSRRVSDLPALKALAAKARRDYGDAYCGGQIGASLQKVLGA